jgi:error-prone DNA polymerase
VDRHYGGGRTGGLLPITALAHVQDKTRVLVGGIVTHRQRPATARGVTFINLEVRHEAA